MVGRNRSVTASVAFLIGVIGLAAAAILFSPNGGNSVISQQWTQIGPAPLIIDAEHNFQGAGPDSGMIDDIAIDPRGTTDQTIYIATENGGIWKTLDGGTTWKPKTDNMPSNSMGAVALDPGNPSIVYAGTGFFIPQGLFKGVGLYKSTDGGNTWTLIGPSFLNGVAVTKIVLPAPNTLLVGTNSGLFLSVDGGANFGNNSPNFNNQSPVLNGLIGDLRLDTTVANQVLAAVAGTGIFVSTDGGQTWPTNLFTNPGAPNANVGFITFAQSTSPNDQTLYASVADSRGQTSPIPRPAPFPYLGLFVSTNGGGTWTGKQTGVGSPGTGCQCGYDQTIGVDPQTPSLVYLGFQELWSSPDSGTTFTKIGFNQVHWDHHALVFSSASHTSGTPTQWYDGSDGGIMVTGDAGTTFTSIQGAFPNSIATNLFRGIDIGRGNSTNNKFTYGGNQDTGTVEFRPPFINHEWHLGIDGDGGPVAVEPTNPSVALGTDDGGATRTTNGGANWAGPAGFPAFTGEGVPMFDPNGTNAYMTAATAPAANTPPNSFRIFFSTDHGANFTAFTQNFGTFINAMSMVQIDSNTLWAGANDGTVWSTSNALVGAAAAFTQHTVTGAPLNQGVAGIAIDPSNTKIVYVIYPGFSSINPNLSPTKHVFVTTDGGTTWNDISGTTNGGSNNLPDLPLHSIVIDPATSPHTIIVSSDSAVFQSADLGQTWQVLGLGMPNVDVTSLALDAAATPPLLRAGTFGRSVFELDPPTTGLIAVNADLTFGSLCAGQQATKPVEVFNVGVADLHIASFTRFSGSTDFTILPNPATPLTISPDAHVDFTIQFKPTVLGPQTATFQINSDDPNTPAFQVVATGSEGSGTIKVTGSGDFGTTTCGGKAPNQTLKINNVGTCNLNVASAIISCADFTLVNPGEFPAAISPDSGLDVGIKFTPTSSGPKSCTLTITTDDPATPTVIVPLTGNTPLGTPALAFPTGLTFPPTVIQQDAACSSTLGVPVANNSACPVTVTAVGLTQTSVSPPGLDYSLTGIAGLPPNLTIAPGGQLGSGDLNLVFAPFALARFSTGTVDVTFINDPVLLTTTTHHIPFCGEGVNRGLRVLVTSGGVPVSTVKQITLTSAFGPEQAPGSPSVTRTVKNAALTTIAAAAPCPGIAFHAEFGGITKQVQLKDGTYKIRVVLKVGKKTKVKVVRVLMDQCSFTPNVVVAF